ncbi:hypothetical protein MLD38_010243 [Melastoma candidum]|uniref:Uncharacterized protein n=1 Tax=Melastoma candidum TaxID=119954 RepID=A0ACB9QYS6_9MYRT|nr:hypothetical protein MLD38_010243 [Melastoma candidum]
MLASRVRRACSLRSVEMLHLRRLSTVNDRTPPSAAPDASSPAGPPPVRVAITETAGRGVFTTRSIGSGELIHSAEPVVCHPSVDDLPAVCYSCLKALDGSEDRRTAAGVAFCGERCMGRSKGSFEVEMGIDFSAYHDYCRSHGLKYPLLVKRLACMVLAGETRVECLDVLQPAYLPMGMIVQIEEEFALLKRAFKAAGLMDERIAFLTKNWYTGILSRIRINAFRVEIIGRSYESLLSMAAASVEAETAVGNAVYMLPSFYNHDCDPNTHIIWLESAVARLKALREIQPGEELRICYIDASLGRDARRALLYQGFGFQCNCPRCLSGD